MKLEFYQNGRQFFFITLTALGDIGLLGSPFLLHVRLTLKKTVAEHAAAIVSLQPETAAIRSIDIRRSQSAAHAFRANCLAMNGLAAALCARG